jgi:glutamine phosphoribosylpyrophosphate amidotransferase
MCEQLVARSAEPFRLDALWPLVERMERYGLAGFGWGATWLAAGGGLDAHRDTRAFRDDPGRDRVGEVETTSVLVHLRRPSKLSTLQLPDTQPFVDPAGRFGFSHNGELDGHRALRERYRREGRIHGRADSEVGERWLEDAWSDGGDAPALLARLHAELGGVANLAVLAADGTPHHYAGNRENPVFTFRLGAIGIASTALYSVDRSLFRFAAQGAVARALVRSGAVVTLDETGQAVTA